MAVRVLRGTGTGGRMTTDDQRRRFNEYVAVAAQNRPLISREEERRLMGEGISHFDLGREDAYGALLGQCHAHNVAVESDIDRRMVPILERFANRRRRISKKRFREAAGIYNGLAGGRLSDEDARIHVKRVMEVNGFRPARSGPLLSRRWYRRVGRGRRARRNEAAVLRTSTERTTGA